MKIINGARLKKDSLIILISLVVSLILLFTDNFGVLGFLRNGISYVLRPVSQVGENIGDSGNNYLKTFLRLGQFTKEYNDMKVELTQKDIQLASYLELENENEILRKQLSLKNYKNIFTLANVLSSSDSEHIRIDQGTKSGISIGDTVSLGNFFVGVIDYVDSNASLVKLPTSSNMYLRVVIMKTQDGFGFNEYVKSKVVSKGVLNGTSNGIMVENISTNSNIENGDIIFVNDAKINDFLVLGYVVGVTGNPASTSRTCYVSTILDYDQLTKVFIKVE